MKATGEDGKPHELWLLTDRLQMPAELVALAYRYRWTIERFFRWQKSILCYAFGTCCRTLKTE